MKKESVRAAFSASTVCTARCGLAAARSHAYHARQRGLAAAGRRRCVTGAARGPEHHPGGGGRPSHEREPRPWRAGAAAPVCACRALDRPLYSRGGGRSGRLLHVAHCRDAACGALPRPRLGRTSGPVDKGAELRGPRVAGVWNAGPLRGAGGGLCSAGTRVALPTPAHPCRAARDFEQSPPSTAQKACSRRPRVPE